ncbi:hypothetical protein HYU18_00195 [Candidatus Woesearchaeota archaeon]|nr:hypothetical protein [Candidatus Woesearchaeota archaeon]
MTTAMETIISNSCVDGRIGTRIGELPPDDRPSVYELLGSVIRPFRTEIRTDLGWAIANISGYVGKAEDLSNKERTVWVRTFQVPLLYDRVIYHGFETAIEIGNYEYWFSNIDGSYLGSITTKTSAQSL